MKEPTTAGKAGRSYILIILFLMFILPILSILIDFFVFHSTAGILSLMGKWFVFWAMGVRLFTAGLRQVLRPKFTAEQILGIANAESLILVQELGYSNTALGVLGVIPIFNANWVLPAAIVGALFYGLAGLRHIFGRERNLLENGAMLSDLFVAAVLLFYSLAALLS